MYYYKLKSDGHIEAWTNNKEFANNHDYLLETQEEPVMQGDGSGYVLPKDFVSAEQETVPTIEERINAIEETNMVLNDTMLEVVSILNGMQS